jgi:hypothetical protein
MKKTIYDLPRNDVAAVLEFLAELGRKPTRDEGQVLIMLQDDPAALFAALDTD